VTDETPPPLRHILDAEDALFDAVWAYGRFCQRNEHADVAIPRVQLLAGYMSAAARPDDAARLWLAVGQLNESCGDYKAAVEAYSRGRELDPEEPIVRYFLCNNEGYSLNELGAHEMAEASVREALEIDPTRYNAYKNLGLALVGQGRFAEGVEALARAVELCPEDRRALGHLEELAARDVVEDPDLFEERLGRCRRLVAEACRDVH
jgi:tetratricopeptide (TPR) repeat protein